MPGFHERDRAVGEKRGGGHRLGHGAHKGSGKLKKSGLCPILSHSGCALEKRHQDSFSLCGERISRSMKYVVTPETLTSRSPGGRYTLRIREFCSSSRLTVPLSRR